MLSGIASAVLLVQTSQDIRQKAYEGNETLVNKALGVTVGPVSDTTAVIS